MIILAEDDLATKENIQEEIAYHESGHCVAAAYFGIEFENVSIIPKDEYEGTVKYLKPLDENLNYDDSADYELLSKIEFQVIGDLAGGIAARKYCGRDEGSSMDNTNGYSLLHPLTGSSKVTNAYFKYLYSRANNLFTKDNGADTHLWRHVKNIANALLKKGRLSYKEVLDICNKDIPQTRS